jgi:glycosyltransferase involved in cell wall biosynthesis
MWFSSSVDPGNPSSLTQEEIEQVQQNSLSTRFVGYQPSLLPLYQSSNVVCLPTRYREGLPTALLEAAACGRPIVATDNVGCREFVENGRTGLMVACGSSTELAGALARLLTDDVLAERLRRNAYDRYRAGFTKSAMLATTIEVMRDLGLQVPPCQAEDK